MNPINPALMAFMTYLQAKGAQSSLRGVQNKIKYEQQTARYQSKKREEEAQRLAEQWEAFRTGNINEGKITQVRAAGGTTLKGAAEFQRAMANNYMLAMMPQYLAGTVSSGVNLLQSAGIQNQFLKSLGSGAANIASQAGGLKHLFGTLQYINPMYALSMGAANKIAGTAAALTGSQVLGSILAGPVIAMAMPLLGKLTSTLASKLTGAGISHKQVRKLRPITIDAKMHAASEFVNQEPMHETNQLINQLYALDPKGEHINIVDLAQLNMLARIASYTSSIPILTSEFVNNIIGKNISSASTYNRNLGKLATFYKGKEYATVIGKHAERMEHGQFAHSFAENLGLAATEFGSFLNKAAIGLDLIKQLQIVMSGGNIKEEMKKFDKAFQTVEQRKAALFAKRLGIGEEESYINMYYSITEDSQGVLSRARTFEDAQIGLLSGIYEFTRMTAVEVATIRTRGYGIKEPVKYNVIGKPDNEKGGILDWLSNKIPFFEMLRMMLGGARNVAALGAQWVAGRGGKMSGIGNFFLNLLGGPHVYRYHDEMFNKMAEGFDIRRETSFFERLMEPIIEKTNKALLKLPVFRILANENRMGLEQKAKLRYQEQMEKEITALMKEVGLEKLEDQQLYYRYATTTMPDQFDLMIHHLANVALFTHATMINTANLSQALTGYGLIEKPRARVTRTMNKYTGKLETEEEAKEFMQSAMKAIVEKAKENAFETKKAWARFADVIKYGFKKGSRKGNDEDDLIKGVAEGFKYLYEKEKLTAESGWQFATEMMYRPLFTEEFLGGIKTPQDIKKITENSIDAAKLLRIRHTFGNVDYEEGIPAAAILKDHVKIKNKNAAEYCSCVTINEESLKLGAKYLADELINRGKEIFSVKYPVRRKPTALISADNTLEGIKEAKENDIIDAEVLQNSFLKKIMMNTNKLVKFFSLDGLKTLITRGGNTATAGGSDASLGALLGTALSGLSIGGLLKYGTKFIKGGGPLAVASLGISGIMSYGYGREKKLIEEFDKLGIIEYNWIGKSQIKDYKTIAKLPLEQLTQLLSFDDWDDKDKQFLQNLVTLKTRQRVNKDTQMKDIIKNEKEYQKIIKQRINENKNKQGKFGYYTGIITTSLTHAVLDDVLTLGGLFSSINSKDKKLYYQLERAAAIRFSTAPFIISEIRDWALIERLKPEQIKSLLKLNLSDEDKKRLQMLLDIRKKQKNTIEREQIRKIDKNIKINKTALARHARMSAADIVAELEDKGIVDHNWFGNSEIKDWDAVKRLDKEQIKKLIEFDDWDNETKQHLQNIYQAKIGKQIANDRSARTNINVLTSKMDKNKISNISKDDVPGLLEGILIKLDQLIGVSAAGHEKQVQATIQVAKAAKQKLEEKVNHPLHDH